MRAIWKGSISFGLVSIPIGLYPATRREDLKFRLLRSSDLSPVNYKRVAEADGKEVPWEQIVKGYEYEKGKFIVLKDEDFARVDVEAAQTVDIINFVELKEINPVLFFKPYYLSPEKGGDKPYALLRDVLESTGKVGISRLVIKARQHLAAIKPQAGGLVLELMHFPEEILEPTEIKWPSNKSASKPEIDMAKQLVNTMSSKWKPEMYQDDYHDALKKIIEAKIEKGEKDLPAPKKARRPSNVVDLVSVLQQSIKETQSRTAASAKAKPKLRKKAA